MKCTGPATSMEVTRNGHAIFIGEIERWRRLGRAGPKLEVDIKVDPKSVQLIQLPQHRSQLRAVGNTVLYFRVA